MKKLKIISIAMLALSLHSCRKDFNYIEPVIPPPANVSFANDVYPILSNATYNCNTCHSGGQAPDFSSASIAYSALTAGFVNTAAPASSLFYIAVTPAYTGPTGQMPGSAPYLTTNEQALILAWITQGALNN